MMKTDEQTKEIIRRWTADGCPKDDAVRIMRARHPNRVMSLSAHLMSESKLRYELLKLYGIRPERLWNNSSPAIRIIQEFDAGKETRTVAPITKPETGRKPYGSNDPLTRAKAVARKLTEEITALHEDAFSTGTANDEKTKRKRKKINDKKRELIHQREELYNARENAYATGRTEGVTALLDKSSGKAEPVPERPDPGTLSDTELTKAFHNTTTAIRRRLNLLDYSQKTRAAKPNPMPPGTRRNKTEKELEDLKAYRGQLGDEIKRRGL